MIFSSRLVSSHLNVNFILNFPRTQTISTLSTSQGSWNLKDDDCSVICYNVFVKYPTTNPSISIEFSVHKHGYVELCSKIKHSSFFVDYFVCAFQSV